MQTMTTPNSTPQTAIVSAITSIITALITAGVTIYTTSNSASSSAQTATDQAALAQKAADQVRGRSDALVPVGAVVAFDFPTDCPQGWEPFKSGSGRVVVGEGKGDGLSDRKYRSEGGVERHQLTVPELPSHSHPGNVGTGGASFEHHKDDSKRMPSADWRSESGQAGGNVAHENMQPFIVLKMCKKV